MFETLDRSVAVGHLTKEELAVAVASADIMLTPSTTETFGNVVLEAMASGIVVVSADVPSARSLITHGENGLLCQADAAQAYIRELETLIGSAGARARIGTAARKASGKHSWDGASASVESAYRRLLR
jgi:glycosyltransferase involved in cell wall biosynthesis